jgi:hypothetical protein
LVLTKAIQTERRKAMSGRKVSLHIYGDDTVVQSLILWINK